MSRLHIAAGVCVGFLFLLSDLDRLRADIPPPPRNTVQAIASPGCAMKALSSSLASRRGALLGCLRRADRGLGRLVLSCSFDAQGKVVQCEPAADKKSRANHYEKRDVACLQKALAALQLDAAAGDPTKCSAQLEVLSEVRHYQRPNRHDHDQVLPPTL
jgi:hypothetical protein